MTNAIIPKISIAKIPVHRFTVASLHEKVKQAIVKKDKKMFLHANARLVELANTTDPWLVDFFNNTVDYVMCDGAGVQLAAKLTGQPVPEKIAYNVWFWSFARFMADNNFTIYFLGSEELTLQKAIARIEAFEPRIRIVGHHHGFFDKKKTSPQNKVVIDHINALKPDVIFVGFGMPIQETWIKENFADVDSSAFFTCGGAFDFFAGKNLVAPYIFRKLYLEWLFRFFLEPLRLFERATTSNFRFVKAVWKTRKDKA
jgi:N-acetylglucosaminyldiphosphoundecaprenol N-acetyl-beta-D-mannosaminyltransferase